MAARILRRTMGYEEIEIPEGHEVCSWCKGKGMTSKYDEGWSSVLHEPSLAAERTCLWCDGAGYRLVGAP